MLIESNGVVFNPDYIAFAEPGSLNNATLVLIDGTKVPSTSTAVNAIAAHLRGGRPLSVPAESTPKQAARKRRKPRR